MEDDKKSVLIEDLTANPAPLGLLGFGLTTVLLNIHNAGFIPLNSMILAMGIAYGGIAQIMACAMEYKKGNTFGTVAFGSYGLFWWSFVLLLVLPRWDWLLHRINYPWRPTSSCGDCSPW
jgi:succinate-acetate transporter protein